MVFFITQCAHEKHETPPNIIYILTDDLGYGDLGCYGQEKIETPNIDRLAQEGMTFTQHYSGQAVSAPSRCVLLTGLHTGHAYIRGNDEVSDRGDVWSHKAMLENPHLEGQLPMPAGTITIANQMQKAGYSTACIGKWGLGYPDSESTPNKMGFDFFYGYNCQRQAHTYYPPFVYRNENREYLNNTLLYPHTPLEKNVDPYDEKNYERFSQNDYVPDLQFKEITNYIEQNKHNPFFLMWTTTIPHVSLQAPQRLIDYYHQKFGEEEPYKGENGYFPCRYPHATYAAMISYLDEQIGLLINQLEELGLYKNTLIIFTSDNGPTFKVGGADPEWFNSAKPFKNDYGWVKASLREGGIRVPMIATWKAKIKAGTTSNHISAFLDVMPTLCEIAKIAPPETDGISFLPTLLEKKQKTHEYLYWEFPEGTGSKALRMCDWKGYITNIRNENNELELYNLEDDPREQNNVAEQHPDIVKEILEKMDEAHEESEIERFRM